MSCTSPQKISFTISISSIYIIQEGLIGLYKAVMDFDGDRFPFFKVFAGVCVTRHIITAVKAASRKKHLPLNSYVSLDKNTYDDDSDTTLLDIIAFSELQDPEAILIDRENMDGMEYKINKVLSKLETEVLVYYLEGLSYQEIAEKLGKDTKAVDNAVQRIKKKLEALINVVPPEILNLKEACRCVAMFLLILRSGPVAM